VGSLLPSSVFEYSSAVVFDNVFRLRCNGFGTSLDYTWSRDSKKIAVTRARFNDSDIVLFNGFR
jgi:hypothetical protein